MTDDFLGKKKTCKNRSQFLNLVTLSVDKRLYQASQHKVKYLKENVKMEFTEFEQYFSTQRISRYVQATNKSEKQAMEAYKANLKSSQAFHPLIGVFEVVFRNQINNILVKHFADPNWIINQKKSFMSDPSLIFICKRTGVKKSNYYLKKEILKAESRIQKANSKVTSGKIIAEQTLGFWTDLFEVHHYRLLKGKPIQIFKHLPSGYGRKEVNDELARVRRFRNRISHNEPICFQGNKIDYSKTKEVYFSIINLLTWIDVEILKYTSDVDKILETITNAEKI